MINLLNRFQSHFSSHILLYHSTFSEVPNDLKEGLHNVTPENLYKQIEWFKKYFDIVEVDEVFTQDNIYGKVAITFDDAYQSVFTEAIPVLKSLNVPCTIFINGVSLSGKAFWRDKIRFLINNSLIDDFLNFNSSFTQLHKITSKNFYKITKSSNINSQEMDTLLDRYLEENKISIDNFCIKDIEYLRKNPLVSYGNHTYNHYVLSSLNRNQQELEIRKNHELLEKLDIKHSKIFSIPFGGDRDFNSTTIELLKKYNYRGFLYSKNAINIKNSRSSDLTLPSRERYMVNSDFNSFQKQLLKLGLKGLIKK
ncbi:MAG: polysaccharide deacetylase family protein [Sulfurovaceae bacterium]|nr:polysaccharide deacetylase family protein [Sulfurovaceae bacterium]